MNFEVQISFDENSIVLQSGDTIKHFANLIVVDQTTHSVISIGFTEQELVAANSKTWQANKQKITFEPVFETQKFEPEKLIWATSTLVNDFHHEIRRLRFFDKLICHVTIPDYETNDVKAREYYEVNIERVFYQLSKMTVNGKTVISKDWKYNFAKDSLELSPMFVILLFLVWWEKISGILNSDSSLFPVYLLILALLGFSAFWITQIVWMFAMQLFFPKKKVRRIFGHKIRTPPEKFSVSRLLADWILGKEE